MAGNSFGKVFKFTTWGESHGSAIGCIIDGFPARIALDAGYIQGYLDKRRPGKSDVTSMRQERDKVEILSGVFEGLSTGTPISLIIKNEDARTQDYHDIKEKFRPGHADYSYFLKYGHRDYRGGGRSSARETAMRVATGAIARLILPKEVQIVAGVIQIGNIAINSDAYDWREVSNNDFFAPNLDIVRVWHDYIEQLRAEGDSAGAIIEVRVKNPPIGLGEPVYDKLEADLAKAIMSINAVKGVEFGDGFATVLKKGSQYADELFLKKGNVIFKDNHNGGIIGGISVGSEIIIRCIFKPTSSISKTKCTVGLNSKGDFYATEISTTGRHDPCVGVRGVPVVEAMVANTLADHFLRYLSYKKVAN